MSRNSLPLLLFGLLAAMACVACGPPVSKQHLEPDHADAMRDSVEQFFESISSSLSEDGPIAWLQHFEESPEFFMASDGNLVFPSSDSAKAFVRGLSQRISAIQLRWIDLRVVPVNPGVAVAGASYQETVTDTAGVDVSFGGFMTGVVRHNEEGWRIQNLHWSRPISERD